MNRLLNESVRENYREKWIKVLKRTKMEEQEISSRRLSSKDYIQVELHSGLKC